MAYCRVHEHSVEFICTVSVLELACNYIISTWIVRYAFILFLKKCFYIYYYISVMFCSTSSAKSHLLLHICCIVGVNVFAILFMYWILHIDAPVSLYFFLGTSLVIHFGFLIPVCS
jgi:hypothetical protein